MKITEVYARFRAGKPTVIKNRGKILNMLQNDDGTFSIEFESAVVPKFYGRLTNR